MGDKFVNRKAFFTYNVIISDIIHPPDAPQSVISRICTGSGWIPPMAKTGMETLLQTERRKSVPLGGSPFLQSVV